MPDDQEALHASEDETSPLYVPPVTAPRSGATDSEFDEAPIRFLGKRIEDFEIREFVSDGSRRIFRARRLESGEDVALKFYPEGRAHRYESREAARREFELTRRLSDPRALTPRRLIVFQGMPVLLLPYVRAATLERIIDERRAFLRNTRLPKPHPWSTLSPSDYLRKVSDLAESLLDILQDIHEHGLIHGNVRPSNVLVTDDGRIFLRDFGFVGEIGSNDFDRYETGRSDEPKLLPRESGATASPLNARRDVSAAAATIYFGLTQRPPLAPTPATSSHPTSHSGTPPTPSAPGIPRNLEALLLKVATSEPGGGFENCKEFLKAWKRADRRFAPTAKPTNRPSSRGRIIQSNILIILFTSAYLIKTILYDRPPPELGKAPGELRSVVLVCNKRPARFAVAPLGESDGKILAEKIQRTPPSSQPIRIALEPGLYLIEAMDSEGGFQEVVRRVPAKGESIGSGPPEFNWIESADGSLRLVGAVIPPSSVIRRMAYFHGDPSFRLGLDSPIPRPGASPESELSPFYLDPIEVTRPAYADRDRSPLETAGVVEPPTGLPISLVSYHEATRFAESIGKRLPTEAEFECAATRCGRTIYPWGDTPPAWESRWEIGPVGGIPEDRVESITPVFGLFSNVAEWTSSWISPAVDRQGLRSPNRARVVRGAPWEFIRTGRFEESTEYATPARRFAVGGAERHPGLGFRCARSASPRLLDRSDSRFERNPSRAF